MARQVDIAPTGQYADFIINAWTGQPEFWVFDSRKEWVTHIFPGCRLIAWRNPDTSQWTLYQKEEPSEAVRRLLCAAVGIVLHE